MEYEPGAADLIGGDGTGPGGTVNTGPFAGWTALIEGRDRQPRAAARRNHPRTRQRIQISDRALGFRHSRRRAGQRRRPELRRLRHLAPWRTTSAVASATGSRAGSALPAKMARSSTIASTSGSAAIWGRARRPTTRSSSSTTATSIGSGRSGNTPIPRRPICPPAGGSAGTQPQRRHAAPDDAGATPAASLDYRRTIGLHLRHRPAAVELDKHAVNFTMCQRSRRHGGRLCSTSGRLTIHLEVVAGSGPTRRTRSPRSAGR